MKTAYGAVSFSCWALLLMALMSSLTVGAHGADVAPSNKDYSYMDSSSVVERNLAPLPAVPANIEYDVILPISGGGSTSTTQTFSVKVVDTDNNIVTAVQIFYMLAGKKAKKATLKLGADNVWSIEIKKLPVGQITWYFVATNNIMSTLQSETYTLAIYAPTNGINCAAPIVLNLYDVDYGDHRYTYLLPLANAVSTCQFECGGDFCASGGWTPGFWFKVNHNGFGPDVYFDMYAQVTSGNAEAVPSITRFQGDKCKSLSLCESAGDQEIKCNDNIFRQEDYSLAPKTTCLEFPTSDGYGDPTNPTYGQNQYFFVHAYAADTTTMLTVTVNIWF